MYIQLIIITFPAGWHYTGGEERVSVRVSLLRCTLLVVFFSSFNFLFFSDLILIYHVSWNCYWNILAVLLMMHVITVWNGTNLFNFYV